LSAVSYVDFSLASGSVSVSDSGSGSSSILFIVGYQFLWYFCVTCSSFCLVQSGTVLRVNSCGSADIPDLWQTSTDIPDFWRTLADILS